ncbi:AAA family ATPase [Rhodoplanes sp. SY1]|uniref:AAA family ATPase n=1 Tax=Rhodoplanes sp. SY1 TaxID=3166646 RepID=UPI0038B4A7FD
MTNHLEFSIPSAAGDAINFSLHNGDVLYLLGANGTGKSSLISLLFGQHQAVARRISAHRQTWFESNTLDMTPRNREDLERNYRSQDAQLHARYREWNPSGRAGMAIFDLIDADAMQERKIARLVRERNLEVAQEEARNPSPIQIINELVRLSNLSIEISVEAGQKVVAQKNGGDKYSVAELSDGERNAFLIAADVLTAKSNSLILVDEPERHLHRSIISPLLRYLFGYRNDCVFVVSTHELALPLDTPAASVLLVRGCVYHGQRVTAWSADLLPPGAGIDDDLKSDILGSRRKMVFVEGTKSSLDAPFYNIVFPDVSIVPKESCRDVEYSVRGLRGADEVHWIAVWGIVDNDQRAPEDIARLRQAGVWALPYYSVESLYYHPFLIAKIAARQADLLGEDPGVLGAAAVQAAVNAASIKRDHLVEDAVLRVVRKKILSELPNRSHLRAEVSLIKVEVDVQSLRATEGERFDALISANNWEGLLTRYPLRKSSAFDRVVEGLKMKDRGAFQAAVLKLLQDDACALESIRSLFGGLYAEVNG